jgi:hypothetical protein
MGMKKVWIKPTGSRSGTAPDTIPTPSIGSIGDGPGRAVSRILWTTELICASATGNDTSYTLKHVPSSPTTQLMIYVNGLMQRYGIDYTANGKTITFTIVIPANYNISGFYSYNYA